MEPPKYSTIKNELRFLSRKEAYKLLLETAEWREFRGAVLKAGQNKCHNCGMTDGPIEEEIPYDIWKAEFDKVSEENRAFKKWAKENKELQLKLMMEGIFRGGLQPIPSRTHTIGDVVLQAHHKFYYWGKLPWEYSIQDLIPLCIPCHTEVHKTTQIITYKDETREDYKVEMNCSRCGGTGNLPEYDYYMNGVCFDCGGSGILFDESQEWNSGTKS